jgi:hypothetical protein
MTKREETDELSGGDLALTGRIVAAAVGSAVALALADAYLDRHDATGAVWMLALVLIPGIVAFAAALPRLNVVTLVATGLAAAFAGHAWRLATHWDDISYDNDPARTLVLGVAWILVVGTASAALPMLTAWGLRTFRGEPRHTTI